MLMSVVQIHLSPPYFSSRPCLRTSKPAFFTEPRGFLWSSMSCGFTEAQSADGSFSKTRKNHKKYHQASCPSAVFLGERYLSSAGTVQLQLSTVHLACASGTKPAHRLPVLGRKVKAHNTFRQLRENLTHSRFGTCDTHSIKRC